MYSVQVELRCFNKKRYENVVLLMIIHYIDNYTWPSIAKGYAF